MLCYQLIDAFDFQMRKDVIGDSRCEYTGEARETSSTGAGI